MVVIGVVFAIGVAACGGSDSKGAVSPKAGSNTTTSTTATSSTAVQADGGGSQSGGSSQGGGGSAQTTPRTAPSTAPPPSTGPTTTTQAVPSLTGARVDPQTVMCSPGSQAQVTVSWGSVNTDQVGVSLGGAPPVHGNPDGSLPVTFPCDGQSRSIEVFPLRNGSGYSGVTFTVPEVLSP